MTDEKPLVTPRAAVALQRAAGPELYRALQLIVARYTRMLRAEDLRRANIALAHAEGRNA